MAVANPRDSFRDPSETGPEIDDDRTRFQRRQVELNRQLIEGRVGFTRSVTLDTSSTTTTLTDARIGIDAFIAFTPTNEAARAEGIPAVTAKGEDTATLTHVSAGTTRTYDYIVLSGG